MRRIHFLYSGDRDPEMQTLKRIREFEAWSVPGQLLHPEYSKDDLQQELWNEGVPKDVFLGVSEIPDPIDCENLELAIQSGGLTEESFSEFCSAHALPSSMQSAESAARFLEYKRGRCLAWIHLPEDAESTLLPIIIKMLAERGHIVIDPASMEMQSTDAWYQHRP